MEPKQAGRAARALHFLRDRFSLRGDPGFEGQHFALSVKCYKGPGDLTDEELREVLEEHGIEPESKCPPVPGAEPLRFSGEWIQAREEGLSEYGPWEWAQRQAWEDADIFTREHFAETFLARGVELESAGRSGGWAVLRGIDARETLDALEDFAELEEARSELERLRSELADFERERAAYAGPIRGDSELETHYRDSLAEWGVRLEELARERELEGYAEALSLRLELETTAPGPETDETERALRSALGLRTDEELPELEAIQPGELPELSDLLELADALETWADFADSMVSDWPRLQAWEWARAFESVLSDYSEDVQRGDALLELARLAGDVVAHVREDPAPDEELRALAEGLERTLSDVSKRWPAGRIRAELRSAPSTEGR